MSAINGDKARFNRIRKQRIHRRMRQRTMFGILLKPADAPVPGSHAKSKEGTA